jgi:two-component system invasion response regulator UvrY
MDVADPATSVLIVDDQLPFRLAARSVVGVTPGFEVVGEARSGEEAVEQVAALHPQLVLMDINMDGISGIEATRRITTDHPETRVILLSTYDAEDLPGDARNSGAIGYLHKEQFGPDVLVEMWSGKETDTLAD